jgi:hypothetical protein
MSRRKRRPAGAPGGPGGAEPAERGGASGAAGAGAERSGRAAATGRGSGSPDARRAGRRRVAMDVGILIAVFAVTAAIAELAGAANLGVALGVGQVAFAIALVVVLLRA